MKEETFKRLVKENPGVEKFYGIYRLNGKRYYRRKTAYAIAHDPTVLSENKKKVMLSFGEASYVSFGKTGFVDGVPVSAHNVSAAMKGRQFKKSEMEIALDKLRETLQKAKRVFKAPVPRQPVQQET